MKPKLFWLIAAVVLVIGFAIYRSRVSRSSDIDPHAAEEIDKAKRR